jgi:hypothetical protein
MKSFLEGKKAAASPALSSPQTDSAPVLSSFGRSGSAGSCPAHTLEVIKEGDRIVRLVITCSCGEKTEVDCIYPLGG